MKTHELELIKTIDELNERNFQLHELAQQGIWESLGIQEVKG